jgi:ATP-dependent helicase HepA
MEIWVPSERLMTAAAGNLVRWRGGQLGSDLGVVGTVNGRHVLVRLDDGQEITFVLPTDVLSRVLFSEGTTVAVRNEGSHGVVTERIDLPHGVAVYRVTFPDGEKLIPEDSLRPAQVTNPVTLLRSGTYGDAFSQNLKVAGARLAIAHKYDELSSLSNSRVDIKPHQVGVLHRVASSYPHRFLLADEVGLGKTIEAGLIIKELKARGFAKRVLVLAPSGIVSQWQFELKTKFNEVFAHYNRATIDFLNARHPGENVWTLNDNVIMSTSFAAIDEARRNEIALAGWDLVVIDEAHHARRTWEGANRYTDTNLFRLASALADPSQGMANGMLLLTATPMQLHRFELYSLVELLDPALFPNFEDFDRHADSLAGLNLTVNRVGGWDTLEANDRDEVRVEVSDWLGSEVSDGALDDPATRDQLKEELLGKHRLSEVLIRNRKSIVGGFAKREARRWAVEPTPAEVEAYERVISYVRGGYEKSRATRNNALGFLMATLQKMNASSSYTLARSLARRIERLESQLPRVAVDTEDEEAFDDRTAAELDDLLSLRSGLELMEEIKELRALIALLNAIKIDSKAAVLRDGLEDLRRADPEIKVLIFTQFRDTQSYLRDLLADAWTVRIFHGQMKPTDKDAAVHAFRDEAGPQVLIATEAGGEGRNLQFAHTMVNYDLPWNPMRIEQRIGRLDRIGQKHPVTIINLAVRGTIEERVLEVLDQRIEVFVNTIGGLDPILGTVETDLRHLFLVAAEDDRDVDRYEKTLAHRVFAARNVEQKLADLIMDTKSFRQDEVKRLLEIRGAMDNTALERFVMKALRQLGVGHEPDPDLTDVYTLRFRGQFLQEFPQFAREVLTRRVTFDPRVALDYETIEFLAFGHELVDAVAQRVESRAFGGTTAYRAVLADDLEPGSGWFFTFVLHFEGVSSSKELVPVFVSDEGVVDPHVASGLLDHASALHREDATPSADKPPALSEETIHAAEGVAIERLIARRDEMTAANRARLEQERDKLTRYFDYRDVAAREKLAAAERVFENVSVSEDPGVQRIIPVWAKNVETARRVVEGLGTERLRQVAELNGRDQVVAQHSMLTGAYVTIAPFSKPA